MRLWSRAAGHLEPRALVDSGPLVSSLQTGSMVELDEPDLYIDRQLE
jgi:hypothetical protein